jgi:TRAP-type C4-dicarboxylate transport system permease small subunit
VLGRASRSRRPPPVVEVLLLLANVIARYVFNRPLVWGDELASILFVWLCVLGAVLAMRRNEHMRLTALISRLPPQLARSATSSC